MQARGRSGSDWAAAAAEPTRAGCSRVADPIRVAARGDQVARTVEFEDVDRDGPPAPAPAPADGPCGHEPEPHQERVEDAPEDPARP